MTAVAKRAEATSSTKLGDNDGCMLQGGPVALALLCASPESGTIQRGTFRC